MLRRRRWSGPGPDSARDPQPFGLQLQRFVKNSGSAAKISQATVIARWAEIVGPGVAEKCTPTTLIDGELTLQCESTAWAAQLRLLAPQLLIKINAVVGQGTVRRIKASGPAAPTWRFGNRVVPGRGPRDTYG